MNNEVCLCDLYPKFQTNTKFLQQKRQHNEDQNCRQNINRK